MSNEPSPTDGTREIAVTMTDRQTRIRVLALQAKAEAAQARERTQHAVDLAAQCGRLLVEERLALKAAEHGARANWDVHFDAHFADVLEAKQAAAMMQLHLGFEGLGISEGVKANNRLRSGATALGVVPAKAYEPTPGDVSLPRRLNHLSFINRFVAWEHEYKAKTRGNLSPAQVARLKADFAPVGAFLAWLGKK